MPVDPRDAGPPARDPRPHERLDTLRRAPRPARSALRAALRGAEYTLALAGGACLIAYGGACARASFTQQRESDAFDAALRARIAGAPAAHPREKSPNRREWSRARVAKYEASLDQPVHAIGRLEIPDVDLSVMVLEGTDDDHARSRRRTHPGHRAPGRVGQPRDRRATATATSAASGIIEPGRRRLAHDARRRRALRGREDRGGESGAHGRARGHRGAPRSRSSPATRSSTWATRRCAMSCTPGRSASRRGLTGPGRQRRRPLTSAATSALRSARSGSGTRGAPAWMRSPCASSADVDPDAVHARSVRAVEIDRVEATARELDPQVALRHLGIVERGVDVGPAPHQPARALHDVLLARRRARRPRSGSR